MRTQNFVKSVVVLLGVLLCVPATFGASSEVLLSQPLTVRWRYQSNVTLNLTPAFDNERIYLPLAGGAIVALKAKDGQFLLAF